MVRRRAVSWVWLRVALVAFVLAWILGPRALRDSVPILVVFLVALGLEIQFLVSALRGDASVRTPDRGPQPVDREWYGFDADEDDAGSTGAEHDADEDADDDIAWVAPPRPRPFRTFAVGVAIIAALVALTTLVDRKSGWAGIPGDRRAEAVARFSREAATIAGKPVTVRCDEARDYVGAVQHADGVAVVGGDLAILTPEVCDDLYRLAFGHETNGERTGRALAVLAHEAWHLRGEADESTTECYALQSGVLLGRSLGLSEARARQLMRQQLIENELRGVDTLEYRLTRECRDGGRLDLRPESTVFP